MQAASLNTHSFSALSAATSTSPAARHQPLAAVKHQPAEDSFTRHHHQDMQFGGPLTGLIFAGGAAAAVNILGAHFGPPGCCASGCITPAVAAIAGGLGSILPTP